MRYYAQTALGYLLSFPTEEERDGWVYRSNRNPRHFKLYHAGDWELEQRPCAFHASGLYIVRIELSSRYGDEDTELLDLIGGEPVPQSLSRADRFSYDELPEAIARARDEAQHIVEDGGYTCESLVVVVALDECGRTWGLAAYESYEGGSGCGYHIPEPVNADNPHEVLESLELYCCRPLGYSSAWATDEEHARAIEHCVEDLRLWAWDLTAVQIEGAVPLMTWDNYHLEAEAARLIAAEMRRAA